MISLIRNIHEDFRAAYAFMIEDIHNLDPTDFRDFVLIALFIGTLMMFAALGAGA